MRSINKVYIFLYVLIGFGVLKVLMELVSLLSHNNLFSILPFNWMSIQLAFKFIRYLLIILLTILAVLAYTQKLGRDILAINICSIAVILFEDIIEIRILMMGAPWINNIYAVYWVIEPGFHLAMYGMILAMNLISKRRVALLETESPEEKGKKEKKIIIGSIGIVLLFFVLGFVAPLIYQFIVITIA